MFWKWVRSWRTELPNKEGCYRMSLCLVFRYLLLKALHYSHYVMAFTLLWESPRAWSLKPLNLWTQWTFSFIVSFIYFFKTTLNEGFIYTHFYIHIHICTYGEIVLHTYIKMVFKNIFISGERIHSVFWKKSSNLVRSSNIVNDDKLKDEKSSQSVICFLFR